MLAQPCMSAVASHAFAQARSAFQSVVDALGLSLLSVTVDAHTRSWKVASETK